MLNLKHITTTAVLAFCLAAPTASTAMPAVDLRSPDSRDAARTVELARSVDLRSPDARDAGRPIVATPAPVRIVEQPIGSGFQWGDAGIGAAGMLALVLLATSLGMIAGQRRRVGRSTIASR